MGVVPWYSWLYCFGKVISLTLAEKDVYRKGALSVVRPRLFIGNRGISLRLLPQFAEKELGAIA